MAIRITEFASLILTRFAHVAVNMKAVCLPYDGTGSEPPLPFSRKGFLLFGLPAFIHGCLDEQATGKQLEKLMSLSDCELRWALIHLTGK
jgi:hypothetical protein